MLWTCPKADWKFPPRFSSLPSDAFLALWCLSVVIVFYSQNEEWLYIYFSLKFLCLNSSFPPSGYCFCLDLRFCWAWMMAYCSDTLLQLGAPKSAACFYHHMCILLSYLFSCWQPLSSSALHTNKVIPSSDHISVVLPPLLFPVSLFCGSVCVWGGHWTI